MDEAMAMERSEPGTGPTPEYEPIEKDQAQNWRIDTPHGIYEGSPDDEE